MNLFAKEKKTFIVVAGVELGFGFGCGFGFGVSNGVLVKMSDSDLRRPEGEASRHCCLNLRHLLRMRINYYQLLLFKFTYFTFNIYF